MEYLGHLGLCLKHIIEWIHGCGDCYIYLIKKELVLAKMWKNRERQVKGEDQAQKKRLFSCYHWGWGDVEKVWIGAGQPAAEGRCIERAGKVDCNVGERGVPGAGWLPGSLCQRHAARAVPDWPLEWWVSSGSYFIVTFLNSPEHVLFNMNFFLESHI